MDTDYEQLIRYVTQQSEGDFAVIVERHLDMVWSVARRITQNNELTRDVSQSVFLDLAQKAGTMSPNVVLAAWLYRAALFAARNAIRSESRRAEREPKAMDLQQPQPYQSEDPSVLAHQSNVLSALDDALDKLPEIDRQAIVLRYFAQKPYNEIGESIGLSDDAAQKRVSRAVDTLRLMFQRNGIGVTPAVGAAALASTTALSAPAGLAPSIAAGSVAAGSAAGGFSVALAHLKFQVVTMKTQIALAAITAVVVIPLIGLNENSLTLLCAEHAEAIESANKLPLLRPQK